MKMNKKLLNMFLAASVAMFAACSEDDIEDIAEAAQEFAESDAVQKQIAPLSEAAEGLIAWGEDSIMMHLANEGYASSLDKEYYDEWGLLEDPESEFNKSEGGYGWFVEMINDEEIPDDHIIFLEDDGTYMYYDYDTDEWHWGFYYIDEKVDYLIFDINTEYEQVWKIQSIDEFDDGLDVYVEDQDGNNILFASYLLESYNEPAPYTREEVLDKLDGKIYYMDYLYEYDAGTGEAYEQSLEDEPTEFDLIAFAFEADEFFFYSSVFYEGVEDTSSIYTDYGTWEINAQGEFILNWTDEDGNPTSDNFQLDYVYGDRFGLSYDDGTFYMEALFLEESSFIAKYQ